MNIELLPLGLSDWWNGFIYGVVWGAGLLFILNIIRIIVGDLIDVRSHPQYPHGGR